MLWRSGQVLRRTEQQYLASPLPGALEIGDGALGDARGRGHDQRRGDDDESPHFLPLGHVLR